MSSAQTGAVNWIGLVAEATTPVVFFFLHKPQDLGTQIYRDWLNAQNGQEEVELGAHG